MEKIINNKKMKEIYSKQFENYYSDITHIMVILNFQV